MDKNKIKMKKQDLDMLQSCYAYGYLGWSRYYLEIENKYGKEATEAEVKKLEAKYYIQKAVYSDTEGCTYNSLIEKL